MVAAAGTSMRAPGDGGLDAIVVGLGATGLSCARFLAARGLSVAVTDSRAEPPGRAAIARELPHVPLTLGAFDRDMLRAARMVVVSPGVALEDPRLAGAIDAGADVVGDIELFARHANAPVIAITGSNGKSTVTTLVGRMFQAAGLDVGVGGNLGTPALDLLREPAPAAYVLELSSFQLLTTRTLDAKVATVLNVSPDHLDRHPSIEEYARAKARIFRGRGAMVLNAEDPMVESMRIHGRETLRFAVRRDAALDYAVIERDGADWIGRAGEPLMPVADLGIRGRHNVANALAACALAACGGVPDPAQAAALREFRGLPHRAQHVASIRGVDYIDDSKGTNVGATCAAIAGMDAYDRVVLIAGGEGKGQSFAPLADLARARLRAAVLIGVDAPRIAEAVGGNTLVECAHGMDEAVVAAARLARPGDAVLLSPACASFDMFANYVARGEAFAASVGRLRGTA
ncbi:MAG: UDP-N-acetylmuramoyl-L-alanine--D-glutamate ligase [Gammaproteobacteria bacterium]